MKYPCLIPKILCKTPIKIEIFTDEISEEGAPITYKIQDLLCNYQAKNKRVFTEKEVVEQVIGIAYFIGDICPALDDISAGEAEIFNNKRRITSIQKMRNIDGTVNYTVLELS